MVASCGYEQRQRQVSRYCKYELPYNSDDLMVQCEECKACNIRWNKLQDVFPPEIGELKQSLTSECISKSNHRGWRVLQFYDSDKRFPAWGFGARPIDGPVSHCFNLNGSTSYCEVEGIQGIMMAYTNALFNVSLAGPTLFGPVNNAAAQIAGHDISPLVGAQELPPVSLSPSDMMMPEISQLRDIVPESNMDILGSEASSGNLIDPTSLVGNGNMPIYILRNSAYEKLDYFLVVALCTKTN